MILQYITGELQPFAVHHYNKALYFYGVYCESHAKLIQLFIVNAQYILWKSCKKWPVIYCESNTDDVSIYCEFTIIVQLKSTPHQHTTLR